MTMPTQSKPASDPTPREPFLHDRSTDLRGNRRFLTDLFAGPFRGHGVVMTPAYPHNHLGDFVVSKRPVREWVPFTRICYEAQVASLRALGDDSVPLVRTLNTNTGVYAGAFGCPLHVYTESTNACALPIVETPQQADRLKLPSLDAPPLNRVFELARLIRREMGPGVPIAMTDLQSPFDIACLIWRKELLYTAVYDAPEAVHGLVRKCCDLLIAVTEEFTRQVGETVIAHCPHYWAPPELGFSLSEDEAGCMSTAMFEEFCLPTLVELSNHFGGMFLHCCATADHQYESLSKIPNLRGLNRVFQAPGWRPAIKAFSGRTVLLVAWYSEEQCRHMLADAQSDTRFLFNFIGLPHDEAKPLFERMRKLCPRQ